MKTFTREDLNNKKYADLVRILKNLGIKGRNKKTEKVIALILAQQNIHENESQNRTNLLKEINDEKGSQFRFNLSFKSSQTEFSFDRPDAAFTSENLSGVDYQSSAKEQPQISNIMSKPVRRSSTFTVNSPQEIKCPKPNQILQVTEPDNKTFRRSSTFTMNSPEEVQQSKPNQIPRVTKVENKPVWQSSTFTLDGPGVNQGSNSMYILSKKKIQNKAVKRSSTFTADSAEENKPTKSKKLSLMKEATNKLSRRSSTFTLDSPEVNQGSNSKHISSMKKTQDKSVKRSSTFTRDSPEENQQPKSKKLSLTKEVNNKLNQHSSTFTVDNSNLSNPQLSKKSEDHKCITKESSNDSKTLDLLCGEIQTAQDIKQLENLKENTSPISSVKRERVWRRSLRGQLLEAKALTHNSVLRSTPSSKSDTSPQTKLYELKREREANLPKQVSPSTPKLPKKDPSEKKSAIPRFVSYALKMPNFARIHAKAFQKMEALDDYVDRKCTRTKSIDTTVTSLNKESSNQSFSKLLTPVTLKKSNHEKKSSRNDQQLKTIRRTTQPSTAVSPKAVAGKNDRKSSCCRRSIPTSLSQPVKENVPPGKTPSNVWNKRQTHSNILDSLQKRKEYEANQRMKLTFNTSRDATPKNFKGYGTVQRAARREILKNNVKKRPKIQTRAEMRATEKVIIKGVRTNRRFELQMANRGIQI